MTAGRLAGEVVVVTGAARGQGAAEVAAARAEVNNAGIAQRSTLEDCNRVLAVNLTGAMLGIRVNAIHPG